MLPVAISPARLRLALAGGGETALRRLRALRAAGADAVLVFGTETNSGLTREAGAHFQPGLPDDAALAELQMLWVTGLATGEARALAASARRLGVLVNVEDIPELCDFYSVAEVRRGDLLLTVSTGGAAPGLAGTIRRGLEKLFPAEWADRVSEVAALRRGWQAEGVPMAEAARRIDSLAAERRWLSIFS